MRRADKQAAHGDQQQPEATQCQVELRHEGAIGGEDAEPFLATMAAMAPNTANGAKFIT